MSASPFKFLDSYTRADIGDFFGRDKETDELFRRCFLSPILVVYGGSGTGKTSLVQCGLSSRFQDSDWLPVPVRRSGDMLASLTEAVREHTLTPKESGDLGELVTNLYLDHFKPIWFLFDQFEELFIFGSHAESEAFFTAIGRLLEKERNARAIFIVREEYLAELTRYERIIPGLIENRYRVERLTQRHAMDVVEKLCAAHKIPCSEGFSAALVGRLDPEGQGIELSYLQVFLDRCWRTRQGDEPFSLALLERIGHVDDMLGAFLDEQVADTPEPQRSESLLKTFVSDQGTKRQLTSSEAHDWVLTIGTGMGLAEVERLLQVFVAKRLLKDRDERGRYELLHDALARQIFQRITRAEQELIEVRQFVQQAHGQFVKRGVKLTANDLTYLRPYRNRLHLKGAVKEFVEGAFREEERRERQKKLRRITYATGGLLLGIALGVFTIQKVKELARSQDHAYSLELSAQSQKLTSIDPLKALAYAQSAFQIDSNEASVKALAAAYDLGYHEIARYNGNFIKWSPAMTFFAIGNDGDRTLELFDNAFRRINRLDSVLLDRNCKFISDSIFVFTHSSGRLILVNVFGVEIRTFDFKKTSSVSDRRFKNDSSTYFTVRTDDLMHVIDQRGKTVVTLHLSDSTFTGVENTEEEDLHLWSDRWAFLLGLQEITFLRFDGEGRFTHRHVLTLENGYGSDPSRVVTVERRIGYLNCPDGIRFYDEEGLFKVEASDTTVRLVTLLSVPGNSRDVRLVWFNNVQKPVFGYFDSDGKGMARYQSDSAKVLEWPSAEFTKPSRPRTDVELIARRRPFAGMAAMPIFRSARQDGMFERYLDRFAQGVVFASGSVKAVSENRLEWTPPELIVSYERGEWQATSAERSCRLHGSMGPKGMSPIGADLIAVHHITNDGRTNWVILDSLLKITAALPDLDYSEMTAVRVRDTLRGGIRSEIILSTSNAILRILPRQAACDSLPHPPKLRISARNVLAGTGWWSETLDSLSLFTNNGLVYCKRRMPGLAVLFVLREDNFAMVNQATIDPNAFEPEIVAAYGEQSMFQYRPERPIILLGERHVLTAQLPDAHSPMSTSCLAPNGSILYGTRANGFAIWDSLGQTQLPGNCPPTELFSIARTPIHSLYKDSVNAESLAFLKLRRHYQSHVTGLHGGRCVVSEWQEYPPEFRGPYCHDVYDSTVYSLISTEQIHTVGDISKENRQIFLTATAVPHPAPRSVPNHDPSLGVDTLLVPDTRYSEILPVARHSLLLRRSENSEDGFAIVIGGCITAEHSGYATAIGHGMILTNHRLDQRFERYPLTPSAMLHMLNKETVYGTTLTSLKPPSRTYNRSYAVGKFLRGKSMTMGLILISTGAAGLVYSWSRRRRRLRAA